MSTRSDNNKLLKAFSKTKWFSNMFLNRCVDGWNSLPNAATGSKTLKAFKSEHASYDLNLIVIGEPIG
jgi:hypothetical protein